MSSAAQALKVAATTDPSAEKRSLADMKPKEQIAYLLESKRGEIAKMMPAKLNPDRLLKVAQIAATTTPALLKCDVASLVGAIGQCAQMGLEPNTVLGHAYLVPFNTKRKDADGNERWVNSVQVIVGYKGLIDLARRSGQIESISARDVCANDKFELVYGINEKLEHTPAMGDRGEVIGFYAIAKLKDGGHAIEWMSKHQIERVRDGSQGWQQAIKYKKTDIHPWSAHFVEMGRKTVIRRLAKYLPLSVEFQQAAQLDELAAAGLDQRNDRTPIDGDFLPLPDADALPDDQQGDDAGAEVPTETAPKATPSKKAPKAEEGPTLWQRVVGSLDRARDAKTKGDTQARDLIVDEVRGLLPELTDSHRQAAEADIAELMASE